MSIYKVLIHPDPRLKLVATDVTDFDAALKETVENMYETMHEYNGIGLAATQVNIQKKIIVMEVPNKSEDNPEDSSTTNLTLINPEIISHSDELESFEEGCLSIPGQYSAVSRPEAITYRYQDVDGKVHEAETAGLLAICIQHEMDHLNGILFIDHISRLKKERIEKKLSKQLKATAG